MQVTASNFFANHSSKSASREEVLAGDGLFDALLRKEAARHSREIQPRHQQREAARPANDDRRPHADKRPTVADRSREPARKEASARPEASKEHLTAEGARPASDPAQPAEKPSDPAAASPAAGDGVPAGATVAGEATLPPGQDTSTRPAQVVATTASTQIATASAATTPAGGLPATLAGSAGSATATSAQPADASTAAQPAAAKPSPATAAKEASQAATQGQGPAAAQGDAEGRARSGQAGAQPAPQPDTAPQPSPFESKPTATLGGGAATAALAQPAEKGHRMPHAESAPATEGNTQLPATARPATSSAQTATPNEQPTADGKAAQSRLGAADRALGDAAPSNSAQSSATTVLATGSPGGTGAVQNNSFAEALAQARPGAVGDPAQQIALQVQRAQVAGRDQISIKLHPAELGRIEVKLENAADGTLRAVISAERSETLDLLQRDARGLERALQEAGVKTDSGSLSFNLRGQGQQQDQRQAAEGSQPRSDRAIARAIDESQALAPQAYRSSHSGALDIRV